MVVLIAGASHTGKTALAQKLLEKYHYPYLSIDHLKMGLIRSGHTALTPTSEGAALTAFLWPVVCELIKTAVENKQNLIVEGCYIPFDWKKPFTREYLNHIKYVCLIMSPTYIKSHFQDIKRFANVIENRGDDAECTLQTVLMENAKALKQCRLHCAQYILIDDRYDVDLEL